MRTSSTFLIMAFAIATTLSCKKDSPENVAVPPPASNGTSFQTLFANNIANATQVFTMDAASGGQVMGGKGTRLIFEPGAFIHPDGTPVTGQVQVSLVEALTMGDMIWLNKQTVGNDNGTMRILRSGGAINVYAEQGGGEVRVTQGGLIARVPTAVGDPAMELFTGSENAQGNMIWNPIDSSMITVDPTYYDSTDYSYTFPYYFNYQLNAPNFNWINCDYFWNDPNTTVVTATIPVGQAMDSTLIWMALPSLNSVMSMYGYQNQTYSGQAAPVGMSAVVIGLRQEANGSYSSFNPVTISSGLNVPMTFTPTTLTQFEATVNAL